MPSEENGSQVRCPRFRLDRRTSISVPPSYFAVGRTLLLLDIIAGKPMSQCIIRAVVWGECGFRELPRHPNLLGSEKEQTLNDHHDEPCIQIASLLRSPVQIHH